MRGGRGAYQTNKQIRVKMGCDKATKSSRLWLHGEWSGTIHGFMTIDYGGPDNAGAH